MIAWAVIRHLKREMKRKERRTVRVYSLRTRAPYTRPTPKRCGEEQVVRPALYFCMISFCVTRNRPLFCYENCTTFFIAIYFFIDNPESTAKNSKIPVTMKANILIGTQKKIKTDKIRTSQKSWKLYFSNFLFNSSKHNS